jgi:hypothetical protein
MTKKILTNLDLRGDILVNGTANSTNGYVLTSNGSGSVSWAAAAGGSFTGGTLTSNLTLAAGTTSLSPLTFQSGTNLTTVTAGANEYDGTVFYQTSNTTTGRALKTQTYEYVLPQTPAGYDFSGGTTTQSLLADSTGSITTRGITLVAGTTYEFEGYFAIQYQSVGDTTTSISISFTRTTVSGTPTTTIQSWIDYGNNTTGFTTAITLSSIVGSTSTLTQFASPGASGSRYITWRGRGIIRVTGSGSVKIYPSVTATTATSNPVSVQGNSYFKVTPVGNGTVTTVGTWA